MLFYKHIINSFKLSQFNSTAEEYVKPIFFVRENVCLSCNLMFCNLFCISQLCIKKAASKAVEVCKAVEYMLLISFVFFSLMNQIGTTEMSNNE